MMLSYLLCDKNLSASVFLSFDYNYLMQERSVKGQKVQQAGAELCQAQVNLISFASLFSTFYAIELINQLCLPTT